MSNSENQQISDTGSGILVGVEPAQPHPSNFQQVRPDQAVSQPVQVVPQQPQGPQPRWTDEDLENARKQEKDKLYGRIDEVQTQLRQMQEERQAELADRQRLAEEAEAARRAKEEGEMEVRDLLTRREQEWNSQIEELRTRYDSDRAVFDKERQLAEVEFYRRDRLAQEADNIIPELREFVLGSTIEEVDANIEAMKARTLSIFSNIAAATEQLPFQQQRGAALTAPPVGPMEQMPEYEQLTPEAIKGMDMDTYKRYRDQLLRASNPNRQQMR